MSVQCHTCGKQSLDPEFCDHCNADLQAARPNLPPERCPLTADGVPLSMEQRHALGFPESAVEVEADGRTWRLHWLAAKDWQERSALLERRLALQISALPPGRLLDVPSGRWLVFETARDQRLAWREPALSDSLEEVQRLAASVHSLANALETLHKNSFVWLNFDPGAIEDGGPATMGDRRAVRFTNLDTQLFPFQTMPERVRVHPHFAAPEILQFRVDDIGPRTDVYHLGAFAYYWLARRLPDGLAGNGPPNNEFALPFLRVFAPNLPEGILPVVVQALSQQPVRRFASPHAFVQALDEAIAHAQKRRSVSSPLRWDIGGHTRTGRAKAGLDRDNEDSILIKQDETQTLALVADGVSTCDIGSGGLASMMTAIVVENAFTEPCTHDSFPNLVESVARRASQGLLEWAFAQGCRDDLAAGKDLMGTTMTLALLQGRELSFANLGDSRAYLVTDRGIEQLTVDGDLASDLLTQNMPPEDIRELGMMARALRHCIGGCTVGEGGEPTILSECCTPAITRWPLVPGDVIVMCTDGLVEEGFFLEPGTVADVVRSNRERPAAEMALLLCEAADAMQRVPSFMEPDGFGDNISCIVIKIEEAVC